MMRQPLIATVFVVFALTSQVSPRAAESEKATFAAGCFWCVEADFDKVPGVLKTISGYTGGTLKDPTYEQVSRGGTGHTEAVEIVFDPSVVTYEQLLDHFWKNVDPLTSHRQFCDIGEQYRPAIFFHNEAQRVAAEESKARVQRRFSEPVIVQIQPAGAFYKAEAYHQDYYQTNPVQYRFYRWRCGRDQRLAELARKSS
jgi:peptide-methionine (S)-S-oxide reductase